MLRYFILCTCFFSFLSFAEDTYIFEAKGDFAKELKTLVEKYSKDSNISIKVYEKKPKENKGILAIFGDSDQVLGDKLNGKELYLKKCSSCHGEDGLKSAYAVSKKIANMSANEIEMAFNGYLNNTYGGKMKMVMKAETPKTSEKELRDIIAFLKNEDSSVKNSFSTDSEEKDNEPTQGTYLK